MNGIVIRKQRVQLESSSTISNLDPGDCSIPKGASNDHFIQIEIRFVFHVASTQWLL